MVRYVFQSWEDNSTNPTRTFTATADISIVAYYLPVRTISYQSSPISVPCTVNGQPVSSGQAIQILDGTQITVIVPAEVNL